MAAQRTHEPPQRPRTTVAVERPTGQIIFIEPTGHLLRGLVVAVGLSVLGFWAPLVLAISQLA